MKGKFSLIGPKIGSTFKHFALKTKHYSPEIMLGVGIISAGFAIVEACKATLKVDKVLEDTKECIEKIHECEETMDDEKYNHDDAASDLTKVYVQTAVKIAKLYLPSALLFGLSITSFLSSNNILKKRNAALAAAYTAIDDAFKKYRERTVERFGKQVDKELRYGIKAKAIEETTVDENGKEVVNKNVVDVIEDTPSGYSYLFDEVSNIWHRDVNVTAGELSGFERLLNQRLVADGYLFLNTVLKTLDLPLTEAGQIVGWIYKEGDPKYQDYVSFGIDWDEYKRNGDPSIFIEPNCHRLVAAIFEDFDTERKFKIAKREWIKPKRR